LLKLLWHYSIATANTLLLFDVKKQRILAQIQILATRLLHPLLTQSKYHSMVNINFTPFPILATERLTLRQLSTDDQQSIFALRSDTAINKYLNRAPCNTIEDAINFINQVNDNIQKNNSIYWVITLTKSKTFVGTICLFEFSNEKNTCEIGYELLTNFQGQGIMKEAAEKVITYAFHTIQLQKIAAFTHSSNTNSTKLLEKAGFAKSIEAAKENPDFTIFTLTNSPDNT
jgi:[ribosomal protein S5]-alanine N-acetyltransferase